MHQETNNDIEAGYMGFSGQREREGTSCTFQTMQHQQCLSITFHGKAYTCCT